MGQATFGRKNGQKKKLDAWDELINRINNIADDIKERIRVATGTLRRRSRKFVCSIHRFILGPHYHGLTYYVRRQDDIVNQPNFNATCINWAIRVLAALIYLIISNFRYT